MSDELKKQPEGRNLYIIGEVNQGMIESVVLPIMTMNKEDSNLKVKEPINIYIHSEGGDTWVGLAIINAIENSEIPINTICIGYAASAAFYILCAGHHRSALKSSSLIVHTAEWGMKGKLPQLRSSMKEVDHIEEKLIEVLEEHTLINRKDFMAMASNDWWMSSEEAIDYSVIDEIIGSVKYD